MTKVSISFTTDQATKTQLDRIAKELGLSTSSLLNILVKQTVAANGIPFDVKAPNPRQLNHFDEETQTEIIKELQIRKYIAYIICPNTKIYQIIHICPSRLRTIILQY